MYAIVKTGGKQYRVAAGDTIWVERLDTPEGKTVTLDHVLFLGGDGDPRVGSPKLDNVKVLGTVLKQGRDRKVRGSDKKVRVVKVHARARKVRVFKYKKRKHYRRTRGHRQELTHLRIEKIEA